MPLESQRYVRPNSPAYVKQLVGSWQTGGRLFFEGRPADDPLRFGYERAIAEVGETLADVPTLDALLTRYYAPPSRGKAGKERDKRIDDICERHAPPGRPLLRHIVEDTAYYRRGMQLLSTWWTADWEPPREAVVAPPPAPPPPTETDQPKPRKRPSRRKTSRARAGGGLPA